MFFFEGMSFPLRDWYSEISFNFDCGKRYLLRFSNISGRNIRVNAWLAGQGRGVVEAFPKNNERYKVAFLLQ